MPSKQHQTFARLLPQLRVNADFRIADVIDRLQASDRVTSRPSSRASHSFCPAGDQFGRACIAGEQDSGCAGNTEQSFSASDFRFLEFSRDGDLLADFATTQQSILPRRCSRRLG